ncbi:MAG: hypothetical protein EXR98_02630 [Gemmataceae bacterium]|nr:hypothetical protein [Gemmataceae bacterium]
MKKLLSLGLLTVCALVVSERQADAWLNSKFSVGLNWHLQSGNNNVLWGLWKNGQVPGPEAFGGMPHGHIPFGANPPAGNFPYFGANPQQMPQAYPTQTAPPPVQTSQQAAYYYGMPYNYGYNPYQTASYQPGGYSYPSYYYPGTAPSSNYQAPYYWYLNR